MTDKDYSDKTWLRGEEDGFQIMQRETAGYVLLVSLVLLVILERLGIL